MATKLSWKYAVIFCIFVGAFELLRMIVHWCFLIITLSHAYNNFGAPLVTMSTFTAYVRMMNPDICQLQFCTAQVVTVIKLLSERHTHVKMRCGDLVKEMQ